ncbi:MAG: CDP-diacylglycerol diphosphatase [Mycolicibacterium cosmeticum]|nr:CDP-diacylglycerol diphosphatase [Mycolicibacterium cosmeticum]
MTNTSRNRIARRIAAVASMAVVPALALGLAPASHADATATTFGPCSTIKQMESTLWKGVDPAKYTPKNKGTNFDIQWPNHDASHGWAVHSGNSSQKKVHTDLLVIPTMPESGIECSNLLSADAPHYFKHAADEAHHLNGVNDWALAINSADSRGQEQMHIHLTELYRPARHDIDAAATSGKITDHESSWVNSVISVTGHDQSMTKNTNPNSYRAWHTSSLDQNFFAAVHNDIAQPKGTDMSHVMILVTKDPRGGFDVLESDRQSGLPAGINNVESLLYKIGGK